MARSALIQPTQQMQFFNLPSGETLLNNRPFAAKEKNTPLLPKKDPRKCS
jgi:hypothetical protein